MEKIIKKLFSRKLDLEKVFNENKHYFELLLVKDFIGYIPKDVNEPALKVFEESGETFERWTLWQSWYINRRAINDPLKITFYNGMMVYLKVLNTIARMNKKNYIPENKQQKGEPEVEVPFIEKALEGLKEFQDEFKNNKGNKNSTSKNSEANESAKVEDK